MYAQNHENVRRIFCEDVRERRSIGRGGYHKKNGSKSRKCSLPSDHLTEGAWKKMNGPVTTANLSAPMDWAAFKTLSHDLRSQYIKMLVDKFNATKVGISEAFGVHFTTLTKELAGCDAAQLFRPGKKMKQFEREALLTFFGVTPENEETECETVAEPDAQVAEIEPNECEIERKTEETEAVEPVKPSVPSQFAMQEFELVFAGCFDADHVANSLRYMVPAGARAKVKISCELE